jgi:uncharacterized membrane protein YeaQ/YmgE (transglycosylase-associated protein family)
VSNIIWIIVIGFTAGIIARFLSPGPNELGGFVLTTGLGIAGAFVSTFIGQTIGWYRLDQGAGLIGATVGALLVLLVLLVWDRLMARSVPTAGNPPTHARRHAAGSRNFQNALGEVGREACRRFVPTTDSIEGFRRQTWDCAISLLAC